MNDRANDLREGISCSCFAVRRAARAITQLYDRHLKPTGLRGTQLTILVVLSLSGPMPLSKLARELGLERTTLTRNLKLLVSGGLVTELPSEDSRVRALAVTKTGKARAKAALPYWRKAQEATARRLGAANVAALHAVAAAATGLRADRSRSRTSR